MNKIKKITENENSTKENLVQDLKESLKDTLDETKYILDDLESTVEKTIKDESISDATKKMVESISNEIKNSVADESQKIIDTIKTTNAIDDSEEE